MVEYIAAFVGPDRADAGPDFLALLVFARAFAVVEDIRWGVWHRNMISDSTLKLSSTTGHVNARER